MQYSLEKVKDTDLKELESLAKNNQGNKNLTESFIKHWYYNNPSKMFSLWKVLVDGNIEGYATTNNFIFLIKQIPLRVAMPQNVLTSEKVRGMGLFNKLYQQTYSENIEEHKINIFLTFTNKLSTPIFLNKFKYKRGVCPTVVFNLFSLSSFFKKANYIRINNINQIDSQSFKDIYRPDNAMFKSKEFYKWRYSNYPIETLHILKISENSQTIGYAILREYKKKGVIILLLMDIILSDKKFFPAIIDAVYRYSSKNKYFGTLMFKLPDINLPRRLFQLEFKNKFNFLVKGLNDSETEYFSQIQYNMFFGDLDIF